MSGGETIEMVKETPRREVGKVAVLNRTLVKPSGGRVQRRKTVKVDPNSPDLSDLFAWGATSAEEAGWKLKDSLRMLRSVSDSHEGSR